MEKRRFTFLMLVALPFVLTGCGTDVEMPENDGRTETATETEVRQTVFSSYEEGTRTSMDTGRNFYWETGDNIWVNDGGTYIRSASNNITGKTSKADFIFNATLDDPDGYEVLYIGQNSPEASLATADALHVKIENNQRQSAWDDATHLGTSGDCGVTTATKNGAGYQFKLTHQASYLIFKPYLDSNVWGYNLTSIDIESENSTELAGVFAFGSTGITGSATSGGTNKVTLKLGTGTAGLPLSNSADNPCYAVIRPGDHKLKVTYHLEYATPPANSTAPIMYSPDTFSVVKSLAVNGGSRPFNPNGVTTIKHKLPDGPSVGVFNFETFYTWSASEHYWSGFAQGSYTTVPGQTSAGYPTAANANRWYYGVNTTNRANNNNAANSAKDMPCSFALTWYVKCGDPQFEEESWWTLSGSGKVYRGGIWLKKWQFISEKPAGSTIWNCPSYYPNYYTNQLPPLRRDKPDASVIDQYFYLPALPGYLNGRFSGQQQNPLRFGLSGNYWSSSPYVSIEDGYGADGLGFVFNPATNTGTVWVHYYNCWRQYGFVAGKRPDGTDWFQ